MRMKLPFCTHSLNFRQPSVLGSKPNPRHNTRDRHSRPPQAYSHHFIIFTNYTLSCSVLLRMFRSQISRSISHINSNQSHDYNLDWISYITQSIKLKPNPKPNCNPNPNPNHNRHIHEHKILLGSNVWSPIFVRHSSFKMAHFAWSSFIFRFKRPFFQDYN